MANIVEIPNERPRDVRTKLNANFGALNAELTAATAAIAGKGAARTRTPSQTSRVWCQPWREKVDLAGDLAALEALTGTDTSTTATGTRRGTRSLWSQCHVFGRPAQRLLEAAGGLARASVAAAVFGADLRPGSPITGAGTLTFGLVK